ncbi:MBL fold metallo-hydrolase [Arthrobacter sp. Br18]|uniref:MBL fold metallo-hydrolase n=1 Tax=Arthrobacter sp. Br18 TaxID=1312954 RepID=UPI0004795D94|nr:MBL fold metallo-hydrolase [Arthrobacter sp. Br18]
MKLTKYTHACVRLEREGSVLVFDPGSFSEVEEALAGAQAILITHEHADHLHEEAVIAALRSDEALELWAPPGVAQSLQTRLDDGAAKRVHAVLSDTEFVAAGFGVRAFGGQHALIHPLIPLVANIGYLVEGNVYHPGDSFVVPSGIAVQTLLVPLHAPWSKVGEVIDFVVAVRAPQAFPIHDALLNDAGVTLVESHVMRIGAGYGSTYRHLSPGESVEV